MRWSGEGVCAGAGVYDTKPLCFARQRSATTSASGTNVTVWAKQYAARPLTGLGSALGGAVNVSVTHDGTTANITLTGPANVWYGVGFNADTMADAPYALIVDGNTGAVSERKLAEHSPGALLKPSLTVISNTVSDAGGIRTVVVSRAVQGTTGDYYSIPTAPGAVHLIAAYGAGPTLAYHKARTGLTLMLLPITADACVCRPTSSQYMTYMDTTTVAFGGYNCYDEPRSDMLRHGDGTGRALPNAACQMLTYGGGLQCCKHHFFLTDREQDALIPNKTDVYYLKWRYYFQEYEPAQEKEQTKIVAAASKDATTPINRAIAAAAAAAAPTVNASHQNLEHWVFLIDQQVNDYEEDNAHYGEASIGKITAHVVVGEDMGLENQPKEYSGVRPLVMTPHCHAPSCIRQEFWNADTGEIICNVTGNYGNAAYGSLSDLYNEANYIAIPPCIFGDQPGLQTPFFLKKGTNVTAIKYFNNTFKHFGQMAQWTGLVVYEP